MTSDIKIIAILSPPGQQNEVNPSTMRVSKKDQVGHDFVRPLFMASKVGLQENIINLK